MSGINFTFGDGALGRVGFSKDSVMGLIMNFPAIPTGGINSLVYNTPVLLKSLQDAIAYGITPLFDNAHPTALCHYHIAEFFRMSPSGSVWLQPVQMSVTMTDMVTKTNTNYAKKLLVEAQGAINIVGCVKHYTASATVTMGSSATAGLEADLHTAIAAAQALAEEEFILHRPVQFLLEGRNYTGTATNAGDLTTYNAPNVAVVVIQDKTVGAIFSSAADTPNRHAAVGTVLGLFSSARVHEHIGWVEKFNLQDEVAHNVAGNKLFGHFKNVALSSGLLLSSYSETDQDTLTSKSYIIPCVYPIVDGVYVRDVQTCTDVDSDYAYVQNVRVIHKAVRGVYKTLMPKYNAAVYVDASGKLRIEDIESWKTAAFGPLKQLEKDGETSSIGTVYIDPDQNILSTNKLNIRIRIQPVGWAAGVWVDIGFTTTLN